MEHTPGPWHWGTGNHCAELFADNYTSRVLLIGKAAMGYLAIGQANAHLIAAAPDLLAALEQTTNALMWCSGVAEFAPVIEPSLKQGLVTIAKARGGAESAEG